MMAVVNEARGRHIPPGGWFRLVAVLAAVLVSGSLPVVAAAEQAGAGAAPTSGAEAVTAAGAATGALAAAEFVDVAGSTHEASIERLVELGITQGTTPTTYGPGQGVTRAQMATFLVRLLTVWQVDAEAAGTTVVFDDIAGNTHADSIRRVAAAGIAQGVEDGRFAPEAVVRRDQMASFLSRTVAVATGEDLPEDGDVAFEDIADNVHAAAIAQLVSAGITQGVSANVYDPSGQVRRDQMASFLVRTGDVLTAQLGRDPQPIGQETEDAEVTEVRPPRDRDEREMIDPVVADEVVVLDGGEDAPVVAYDQASGELALDAAGAEVSGIEVGSVLVSDVSEAAPQGFLRRVTSVEQADGQLLVASEQATFTDLFEEADIYLEESLDFTTVTEVETFVDGLEVVTADGVIHGEQAGTAALQSDGGPDVDVAVSCDLSDPAAPETIRMRFGCGTAASVVFEGAASTSDDTSCDPDDGCVSAEVEGRAELTGTLDLTVDFVTDLELRASVFNPVRVFEAYLEHEADANLDFVSNVEGGFEAERRIAQLRLSTIRFFAGPVPVVVSPSVDVYLGADGAFEAVARWDASYTQRTVAGVGYVHGEGWGRIWDAPDPRTDVSDLTATGQGDASTWVRGRVTPEFYGVVGPYFELRPYLRGEVEVAGSVGRVNAVRAEAALAFGMDGRAGVDVTIPVIDYSLAAYETRFSFFEYEFYRDSIAFFDPLDRLVQVSVDADGQQIAEDVRLLGLSDDGRRVLVETTGDLAAVGVTSERAQPYVVDVADGSVLPVVVDVDGEPVSEATCGGAQLSADGGTVTFSCGEGLPGLSLEGEGDDTGHIYRHVLADGPPELLNVFEDEDGELELVDATEPQISGDGERVVFRALASVPGDDCLVWCLQVYDAEDGVATSMPGAHGFNPRLSRDGNAVVVRGRGASTLLIDVATGEATRLNPPEAGHFVFQDLSSDSGSVVFTSRDPWDAPDAQEDETTESREDGDEAGEEPELGGGTFLLDTETFEVERVSDNRSYVGWTADDDILFQFRDSWLVAVDLLEGEDGRLLQPERRDRFSSWRVAGDGEVVAFQGRSNPLEVEEGAVNVYLAPLVDGALDPETGE